MHPVNIEEDADRIVSIDYTNYRNERRVYRIIPHCIKFGRAPFHSGGAHWYMEGTDVDRNVVRNFELKKIHSWTPT